MLLNKSRIKIRAVLLLVILTLLAGMQTELEASTPTLVAQDATAAIGETVPVPIVLSDAPSGLAGFDMVITLSNKRVASITGVDFPDLGLTSQTLVSGSEVHIRAADLQKLIEGGATNATLATLSVQGLKQGSTDIDIQVVNLDDDGGFPIQAQALSGTLSVKKDSGSGDSGGGKGGGGDNKGGGGNGKGGKKK